MIPAREFRSDIEGLRGIAILLVVAFHAGVPGLAGGFVGVDVFFVFSGFFVTGMLARELAQNGAVDLNAFYGQRAVRLLPTLLVVLLATMAAVMWLYAPIDRAPIAANVRSVALFSGNMEFATRSVDYFGTGDNPLLHTWSLAVEEQFYFVWPLLFLFVAFVIRKRIGDAEDQSAITKPRLLTGIAIAGVLSFMLSLWLTKVSQPWAFFGLPARIWEFALGGALALTLAEASDTSAGRGTLLQVIGAAMIVLAVVTYDRATPYPGIAAVLPALAAVALLAGGQWAPASFLSRALSASWLLWLGRMSFAWFLWHWPLVGIGTTLNPEIGVGGRLAWSAAALVLAWLTYSLIERPARDSDGYLSGISRERLASVALGVCVAAALAAHATKLVAERQTASGPQRVFADARNDRMEHGCWGTTVKDVKGPCVFGDARSTTTIALLGDSHAEHWLGALDRIGKARGWRIVAMVKGGCPVADMPDLMNARLERKFRDCVEYREAMVRRIIAMRPTAAILSSWDHYIPVNGSGTDWQVTPDAWRRGLRRTYQRLSAAGIRTVAIRGTPRTWFDVPSCLSRRAARLPFGRSCEYDRARSLSPAAVAAQSDAARGLNVALVDMNDVICATRRCPVVQNGVVVFTDDNHLTASFSRSVATVLGARLERALP